MSRGLNWGKKCGQLITRHPCLRGLNGRHSKKGRIFWGPTFFGNFSKIFFFSLFGLRNPDRNFSKISTKKKNRCLSPLRSTCAKIFFSEISDFWSISGINAPQKIVALVQPLPRLFQRFWSLWSTFLHFLTLLSAQISVQKKAEFFVLPFFWIFCRKFFFGYSGLVNPDAKFLQKKKIDAFRLLGRHVQKFFFQKFRIFGVSRGLTHPKNFVTFG